MVRPVTEDDIGLKVLHEAPAEASQIIDIVAIHGIGAHPDDSWCRDVGPVENPRRVNWLVEENMLPAIAPYARIMRYGYESQWFGEDAIRQTASGVARRLLLALKRVRDNFPFRQVLFVAHCFGGLVLLKALLEARQDTEEWPGIFDSVIGLLFFGTPFRGAEGMSQSRMLETARTICSEDQIQEEALKILEPGNGFLQDLVDQFCRTWAKTRITPVACFYELKPSDVGTMMGGKASNRCVVSEGSACLDISGSTKKYSISRNHYTMVQFGQPMEEDFQIVCGVIKGMVEIIRLPNSSTLYKGSPGTQTSLALLEASNMVMALSKDSQTLRSSTRLTDDASVLQAPKNKGKKRRKIPRSNTKWSPPEDENLLFIVQAMESTDWDCVAQHFEKRSSFACQKRYEKLTQ